MNSRWTSVLCAAVASAGLLASCARRGVGRGAMIPVVEDMTDAQMLMLAAYLASLPL